MSAASESSQTPDPSSSPAPRAAPTELPLEAPPEPEDFSGSDARDVPPEIALKGRKARRSDFQKAISRNVGYLTLRLAHAILSRLPLWVGRALARALGTAAYYLIRRERLIALHNLQRAFGKEKTPAEIRAIARGSFQNMALTMVEFVILRRWSPEKLRRAFPEVPPVVDQFADDIRASGKGCVGFTGHCGNWEVLSLFYGRFRPGVLIPVANRIYDPRYQEFFHQLRTGCGVEVLYTDESPRKIIRALKAGCLTGTLADVDLRTNSGVFVEFFGQPAWTITFPVELVFRFGLTSGVALLFRDGKKFRFFYSGLLQFTRTGDESADILAGTQQWTRILEEQIRLHPDQWAWMQPRWRTTPDSPRRKRDRKRERGSK